MSSDDLLWRKAAALARSSRTGTENEERLPCDDGCHQFRDELRRIAAVPVKKDDNFGVRAQGGNSGLDSTPVTASCLDNYTGTGRGCPLDRPVPRAAVYQNDLAHALRKHGAHDRCNCRFLVEAWNDCRHDGLAMGGRIALARGVAHRLQRSPQLAQAAGGLSDNRALRNSRYAGPFQISRKVCCLALPRV